MNDRLSKICVIILTLASVGLLITACAAVIMNSETKITNVSVVDPTPVTVTPTPVYVSEPIFSEYSINELNDNGGTIQYTDGTSETLYKNKRTETSFTGHVYDSLIDENRFESEYALGKDNDGYFYSLYINGLYNKMYIEQTKVYEYTAVNSGVTFWSLTEPGTTKVIGYKEYNYEGILTDYVTHNRGNDFWYYTGNYVYPGYIEDITVVTHIVNDSITYEGMYILHDESDETVITEYDVMNKTVDKVTTTTVKDLTKSYKKYVNEKKITNIKINVLT